MEFVGRGILLDIEGTTSSVRFVYDVMFPYARREAEAFLAARWDEPAVRKACDLLAVDAGHASLAAWTAAVPETPAPALVLAEVHRLMDQDKKSTGLKELQGLVWEKGFRTGEMQAHVYPDVPASLHKWHAAGLDVRIYSSGSIAAQKLFFGHSIAGDLLPLFRGHYDTTTGPKREAASYATIAAAYALPPSSLLFLSDIPAELDAAAAAGFRTALLLRPDNAPVPPDHGHPILHDFAELHATLG